MTKTDLGVLFAGDYSFAYAINESGAVVGSSEVFTCCDVLGNSVPGVQHAFIWRNGVMQDLNQLIPPGSEWVLTSANDINARGQIVGYGTYNGVARAFLLTADTSPPTTTLALNGPLGSNGWYVDPVQVALSATDPDGPGDVAATHFFLGPGVARAYSAPFTVAAEGFHALLYWSVDRANNTESIKSDTFRIDSVPPTTTGVVSGPAGNNGWFQGPATLTLSASDAMSGVDVTYYSADGGPLGSYAAPVVISGDGLHTVDYWSIDVAGNQELSQRQTLRIDTTPPGCRAIADPATLWSPNNRMRTVHIVVTATDSLSGVERFVLTGVTSSPPVNGPGEGGEGDIYGFAVGTPDLVGMLRAKRGADGARRTYTLTYLVSDLGGNQATCSVQVVVPQRR